MSAKEDSQRLASLDVKLDVVRAQQLVDQDAIKAIQISVQNMAVNVATLTQKTKSIEEQRREEAAFRKQISIATYTGLLAAVVALITSLFNVTRPAQAPPQPEPQARAIHK